MGQQMRQVRGSQHTTTFFFCDIDSIEIPTVKRNTYVPVLHQKFEVRAAPAFTEVSVITVGQQF